VSGLVAILFLGSRRGYPVQVIRPNNLVITVDRMLKSARTNGSGSVGDGKIFISPLEECI
jgi:nitrogen regulatory protein PII